MAVKDCLAAIYISSCNELFLVQKIFATQDLEILYVFLSACTNLICRVTCDNHLLDIINARKEQEHTSKELLGTANLVIGIDNVL